MQWADKWADKAARRQMRLAVPKSGLWPFNPSLEMSLRRAACGAESSGFC